MKYSQELKQQIYQDRTNGMKYKELSEKYGIPLNTIKGIIFRYDNPEYAYRYQPKKTEEELKRDPKGYLYWEHVEATRDYFDEVTLSSPLHEIKPKYLEHIRLWNQYINSKYKAWAMFCRDHKISNSMAGNIHTNIWKLPKKI